MELMGALLAARLAKEVKKILDQKCSNRAFFWTDSQVTLHWIKGPSHRWKPFVANRVREIQSLTDLNSWFHCSGKDNPADLLTRGISVDALTTNSKWWNGSSFLRQIDFQTKGLDEAIPERVYLTEMRKNSNPKEDISLTLTVTKNNFLENVIDISNKYVKLIRVVSFLYRFIHNCRTRITKIKGPLTSQEVSHAENWLIHSLHEREFYEEMRKLLAGTLVLIKDENLPSTKWSTGRITEIFPGTDGKVRVVNLRMPNGNILKRTIRNLCILPDIKLRRDSLRMCLLPEMDSSHRMNSFLVEKSDHPRLFAISRSLSLPSTLLPTSDDRDSCGMYLDMGGFEPAELKPHEKLLMDMKCPVLKSQKSNGSDHCHKEMLNSLSSEQYVSLLLTGEEGTDIRALLKKGLSDSQQELLDLMQDFKEGECTISNVEKQFQLWREKHCTSHGQAKRRKTSAFVLPWRKKKETKIVEQKKRQYHVK
ncbi:DUF5641 domain-containing protein [Trichonephila clavipes]|nr:DUF5641 domain-containing protein [Trichonephila clavipes]